MLLFWFGVGFTMTISYFQNTKRQKLAYVSTRPDDGGRGSTVLFLGGFKSDMTGTKAVYLEEYCKARGQAFVRFDYSGHGASDGEFADGTISEWSRDAQDILDHVVQGDVILVGSSMGGWIALKLLLANSSRVKGVIGIAAAPDFTRAIPARMTDEQKQEMAHKGRVFVPTQYGEPYVYTKALLDDGEENILLDRIHRIDVPLTLLQGKLDDAVPWETALRIREYFIGPKTDVILIDDGDHRLSRPEDLALLGKAVAAIA